MASSIFFPICAIPFSILLIVLFFTKKRINSIETKIYSRLLVINFIGLLIELLCTYASYIHDSNLILSNIILKSYVVYNIVFTFMILYYLITISFEDFKYKIFKAKYYKFIIFLHLIFIIVIYILPINLIIENDFSIRYTRGPSVNVGYIVGGIHGILMALFSFIGFKKNIINKKFIPIFFFLFVFAIGVPTQYFLPELLWLTFIETFILAIMYFTIENPDVKMLEQVQSAKDQAEKANAAKSDFLSSMSHEIRTPLNAIVGFSNSLLDDEKIPVESKEDIKNIIMASDSLLDLVNGILDISKIEANKLEIININYNFKKMFDELVLLTKARLGEKPLDFRYKYDESIPEYLYGDGTRVKQVILNLLTNSVKYTKDGYVDFSIKSVARDNVIRLIIRVEDSGIGIKKESINKLFSKFERLGVEKDTTTEGTGLGLAITKRLVEMMNGQIAVQSIYGKGSIFSIAIDQVIPSTQEMERLKKENATVVVKEDEVLDYSNYKVLIVDDNPLNLKVAEKLLKKYNLNVETVNSGYECIESIACGNKYDLILLDDMMPKMSGTQTLVKLRDIPSFTTPVVALTANAISGMKEEYISKGFNDYLSKPIEREELVRVLKKYLKNN